MFCQLTGLVKHYRAPKFSNKFKRDANATGSGPHFENYCNREYFQTRVPGLKKNCRGLWKFLKIQGQASNLACLETNSVTYSSLLSITPSGIPDMKTI